MKQSELVLQVGFSRSNLPKIHLDYGEWELESFELFPYSPDITGSLLSIYIKTAPCPAWDIFFRTD